MKQHVTRIYGKQRKSIGEFGVCRSVSVGIVSKGGKGITVSAIKVKALDNTHRLYLTLFGITQVEFHTKCN